MVTACSEGEGTRSVIALDGLSGAVAWRYDEPFTPHPQHQLNSFASSTPAVGDGLVHVVWTSGDHLTALCLDALTGERVWHKEIGPYQAQHGSGASPVLAGGVLIIANDNEGPVSFLTGLDPATGKELWVRTRTSTDRRASYSTPSIIGQGDGALVVFASTSHGITALKPGSGQVSWEFDPGFKMRTVASPSISGGVLFQSAGSGGGGKEYVALHLPAEHGEPTVAWETRLRAIPYVPTAVGHDGHFFMFSDGGVGTCVESDTGAIRWQERIDGRVYASPILAGDKLVVLTLEGDLLVLDAAPKFHLRCRLALDLSFQASPAIWRDHLIVRSESEVIALTCK